MLFSLLLSFNVEFFLIRTKFFGSIIRIQGASMINSNTTGESIFDAIIGADQSLDTISRAMLKIAYIYISVAFTTGWLMLLQ